MWKRWLLVATALIVSGCGGMFGGGSGSNSGAVVAGRDGECCQFSNSASFCTPLVEVQRCAPAEGCVDEEIKIEIHVTAREHVSDVVVRDQLSSELQVVRTEPEAQQNGDTLEWHVDTMNCGECQVFTAYVKSNEVGCIHDCVTVSALPRLCVSTFIGKCNLTLEKCGPDCLCVGQAGYFTITVGNNGSAVAKNVVVTDMIPDGLQHSSGDREVCWNLGNMEPGCCETLSLCLEACAPGCPVNVASASADNFPAVQASATTRVVEADIDVSISGDKEQFIGKEADFVITVTNTGTDPLCDVTVTDRVSECSDIVCAEGASVRGRCITWCVDRLDCGESESFNLTLFSCTPHCCDNDISAQGCGECCGPVCAECDCQTTWKGMPGLLVEMIDVCDPLIVGECGSYRIRVTNQGSAPDEDIRVVANFPSQLEPFEACGDTAGSISGQTVTFDEYDRLCPGESLTYSIEARANETGDARVEVELYSNYLKNPVTEEESTSVY